jgi:AbrB family looped-hinge helix DNA binding protein
LASEREIKFYGSVTVSMRGQIVIPTQARRELNIQRGEKLLVLGGPGDQGLALIRASAVDSLLKQWTDLIPRLQEEAGAGTGSETGE